MTHARIVLCGVGPKVEGLHWESDSRLRIGRRSACEVVVTEASVSREHSEIVRTADGWVLRDLGSRYGTFVNGARMQGPEHVLRVGDLIQVGQLGFRVTAADHAAPAERPQAFIRSSTTCFNLQATTSRSWGRAVKQLASNESGRLWPAQRFLPLLHAGHYLTQMTSLDELLRTLLEEVATALDAQRGAIVLADEVTGKLRLRSVVARDDSQAPGKHFSETLADRCYLEGESLLCSDVNLEEDLANARSVAHGTMASIICALMRTPRRRLGVLHLDRGPWQEPFTQDDFDLVDAIACYVSVGIESAQMMEQQRDLFLRAATTLAQTVEMRDESTGNHTQRVTAYALMLADELGLSAVDKQRIEIGTPLHDIGKISVDDAILRKPGKLTAGEQEQMQTHVTKGAALLANIPGFAPMLSIIRHHHERWDGKGYPEGLAGEAIPLLARVVAVADSFDAMTSDRPYRRGMPLNEALAELAATAGSHFDPTCVAAFLRLRPRIEATLARSGAPTLPGNQADTVRRAGVTKQL